SPIASLQYPRRREDSLAGPCAGELVVLSGGSKNVNSMPAGAGAVTISTRNDPTPPASGPPLPLARAISPAKGAGAPVLLSCCGRRRDAVRPVGADVRLGHRGGGRALAWTRGADQRSPLPRDGPLGGGLGDRSTTVYRPPLRFLRAQHGCRRF